MTGRNRTICRFLGLLALTGILGAAPVQAISTTTWEYMAKTRIDWRPYRQQVLNDAKISQRPVFILIYADWCEWCKTFEKQTLETEAIRRRLATDYIPVAVNYDRESSVAKSLGARLVPTTLLVTPEGKKLVRFYGLIQADDLMQVLDQTLSLWRKGELPEKDEFGTEETCCPLPPE